MSSFYLGIVASNKDPQKQGRLKVALEGIGDGFVSHWLPMLSLHAGMKSGFFVMPEIGSQVAVAFLDQRHREGYVLGCIWGPGHKPPKTGENSASDLNADGKNNLKFFQSKSGQQIIFDDTKDKEKVQLIGKGGKTRLEFDAKKKLINLETDQGITISAKKTLGLKAQTITITTEKTLGFDTAGLALTSSKALSIEASKDLGAEGNSIKLN